MAISRDGSNIAVRTGKDLGGKSSQIGLDDSLGDLRQYRVLSGGLTATDECNVQCALHICSGRKVVLKVCPRHEAVVQMRLQLHKGIAAVLAVIEQPRQQNEVVVVQEYYGGGELLACVVDGGMEEGRVAVLVSQIADTVRYMHREGVAHRDIKLENIVLTTNGESRLIDFGTAKCDGAPFGAADGLSVGTIAYMPPELLDPIPAAVDCFAGDVWSLGVVCFALLQGAFPWACASDMDPRYVVYRKRRAEGQLPAEWGGLSAYWSTLLTNMLALKPAARWTMDRVCRYLSSGPPERDVRDGHAAARHPVHSQSTHCRPNQQEDRQLPLAASQRMAHKSVLV